MVRTIEEGVDLGFRGKPRNHRTRHRVRTPEEKVQLAGQYKNECELGRVRCTGRTPPYGKLFSKFFVSPTYTIPKKRKIGQPQKWRLIHNLSGHRFGREWSINAGIDKGEFPITYPSIGTALHKVFCEAPRGCVVWGRDLKEYYRHLMINPFYWWSMGTEFEKKYYFDCYCPFGARSMPAIFQRLSDAIRVIMLRRTPVDALLGMLDDFLGITYRNAGESDEVLVERGEQAAQAFDEELVRMGISKQSAKDSPASFKIVWLGVELDTKMHTISIPEDKITNTILFYNKEIFEDGKGFRREVNTRILDGLIGVLCYYSQAWSLGKTLLWPLYVALGEYRKTVDGKPHLLDGMVELNGDCIDSLTEWYHRLAVCGLSRKFYTCKGRNMVTVIELWWRRRSGMYVDRHLVRLVTPWKEFTVPVDQMLEARSKMLQVLASAIDLLHQFFESFVGKCGEVIEVRTNVARFERYIRKQCYPKGLNRECYIRSVAIQRLLEGPEEGNRHPARELKAYYIY